MLQDLATQASTVLATASMLFFLAVYAVVFVQVVRARTDDLDVHARMALDPPSPKATEGRPLPNAMEGRPSPEAVESRRLTDRSQDAAPQGVR